MTECERIIRKRILSSDFFKAETICDFYVDEKRKKLWAIEIDLLLQFDKICKAYNLSYFLSGGSLLGAIRHNGFIPWDDDIDVVMPRKDYNVFCEKGSGWFKEPYFLQTPETDLGYYYSYIKIRNSKTTLLGYPHRYQNCNHGIGIDVFPLDKCVLERGEENFNKITKLILENSNYMRSSNPKPSEDDIRRMKEYFTDTPMKNCEEINRIASQYEDIETEYIGVPVCVVSHWKKLTWYAQDFSETIKGDFHGFSVPIPKGYDRVLKTMYGEYMKFPPKEERGTWHNSVIIEPDIPYQLYKKEMLGMIEC